SARRNAIAQLPAPAVEQVRMDVVASRNRRDACTFDEGFLNDLSLLFGSPAPPSLRTRKDRCCHRICPLICKLRGKPALARGFCLGGPYRTRTTQLPVQRLSPILRNKHNVIFALPLGVA